LKEKGGVRGVEEDRRSLAVLTFEVGDHRFAVPAGSVARILPAEEQPPEGIGVVDAVGLLPQGQPAALRGCVILLADGEYAERPVAITASRAGEVRPLDSERLLPVPGFLFRGDNPFLGLIPPEPRDAGRALFLLAGPERLLACAGAR
jgi:hypothetical protein